MIKIKKIIKANLWKKKRKGEMPDTIEREKGEGKIKIIKIIKICRETERE